MIESLLRRDTGEALTSDLRAVIVKVATLTKAGRYRPKKIANGVNKLHGVEQPSEAKDVYDEFSPEELAATTEHVSKDMVQERLEADRESQPLEGPWKHLRKQVSAQAAQQSNQHVSGSAYGRDSVRGSGAESGLRDAMQKAETASQIAEVYRRRYGALSRGD